MAAMQQRPQHMGMQPPPPSPGHAQGHPPGPHGHMGQPMGGPPQAQNPSLKIPFPLLPHVHLKSHQPYPIMRRLDLPRIIQYLKDGPRIVNGTQPVEWTYLDPPADGTVMLMWQAPGQVQFASDGFWWCDVETSQTQPMGNYNLEIFSQRIGYIPGEQIATHTRTRYRLTPNAPPNQAPCDPCLWIVRWFRADSSQHLPINQFPQNTPIVGVMTQRAQISKAGQLVKKPFMLTDMNNWPMLQMPDTLGRPRSNSQAMQDLQAAKRLRTGEGKDGDEILETIEVNPPPGDDDDKDIYDLLTPRDLSIHRYTRHNEWIEELFASPYSISAIKPASLGLGRGGPLRKLTKAYLQPALDERLIRQPDKFSGDDIARTYPTAEIDDFEKQVQSYLAKDQAESETRTRRHEASLAQLRDKSFVMEAETRLRYARTDPDASDPLDIESGSHFQYSSVRQRPERIDDLVAEVSARLNGPVLRSEPTFRCVAQGGYQTPPPPPSPPAEEDDEEEDEDMGEGDDSEGAQFMDYAEGDGNGGLSAQPHPDAAHDTHMSGSGSGHAPSTLAGLDGAADTKPDTGASAAASAALAAERANDGNEALPDLNGGASKQDSGSEHDDEGGDAFGASLDFGDLPDGDEGVDSTAESRAVTEPAAAAVPSATSSDNAAAETEGNPPSADPQSSAHNNSAPEPPTASATASPAANVPTTTATATAESLVSGAVVPAPTVADTTVEGAVPSVDAPAPIEAEDITMGDSGGDELLGELSGAASATARPDQEASAAHGGSVTDLPGLPSTEVAAPAHVPNATIAPPTTAFAAGLASDAPPTATIAGAVASDEGAGAGAGVGAAAAAAATTGQTADEGADGGGAMEFEDSAFGDAFHHSEFE